MPTLAENIMKSSKVSRAIVSFSIVAIVGLDLSCGCVDFGLVCNFKEKDKFGADYVKIGGSIYRGGQGLDFLERERQQYHLFDLVGSGLYQQSPDPT